MSRLVPIGNTVIRVIEPTDADAANCSFCPLTIREAVDILRRVIRANEPHSICTSCRRTMKVEIKRQFRKARAE